MKCFYLIFVNIIKHVYYILSTLFNILSDSLMLEFSAVVPAISSVIGVYHPFVVQNRQICMDSDLGTLQEADSLSQNFNPT